MSSDNIATLALRLDSNQFLANLGHASNAMRNAGMEGNALAASVRGVTTAMLGLVAGNQALRMLTSSILSASAAREDLAQFNHVMRNVTKTADEMIKTLTSDAFGRTDREARRMLMGMTSLAKGMGLTDKAAVKLSGEFSKMAIDIGSFMMVDPTSVMSAFESAMMGNTIALRTYGVYLNETTIKATIAANAKKGLVFASEREARAYAVLSEAQKQQADAIGDYAVEAQNFGNQLRKFYGGLSELPEKFGKGLLVPANEALKVVNNIIDKLRAMDYETWKTISTITALGTATTLVLGTYKIGITALEFYKGAQAAAALATAAQTIAEGKQAVATTGATAAINAETAALGANTAAKMVNVKATAAGAVTVGTKTAGVAGVAMGTPWMVRGATLPHQSKSHLWDQQLDTLRQAHRKADNAVATANVAWDTASRQYEKTGDVKYLYSATQAQASVKKYTQQRDNLEQSMQSLHNARRSNPHHLTAQQRASNADFVRKQRTANRKMRTRNVATVKSQRALSRAIKRVSPTATAFRRSPLGLVGRGVGGTANAIGRATGLTWLLKSFETLVMKWLPTGVKTWGGVLLRSVATALLPLGGTIMAMLNPVGWAATILTGIAAVGNYLPTLMYKAYDGFISLFSEENMSKIWEWFKTSAWSALEWMVEGLKGFGNVLDSIWVTTLNMLGNGLRKIILSVTRDMWDIGEFNYESAGYAAHKAQQETAKMQDALNQRKEEQAKIEKRILDMRQQITEQERKWQEQEQELLSKRKELATGRLDATAKAKILGMQIPFSKTLANATENAINSVNTSVNTVKDRLDKAAENKGQLQLRVDDTKLQFERANEQWQKQSDQYARQKLLHANGTITDFQLAQADLEYRTTVTQRNTAFQQYRQAQEALDKSGLSLDSIQTTLDVLTANRITLTNDHVKYATALAEQRYALFDARFEQAGKQKTYVGQMGQYSGLLAELKNNPILKQQKEIEIQYADTSKELTAKKEALAKALADSDTTLAAMLQQEIESAENKLKILETSYEEIQANLSDQRKVKEKMDELYKEQAKRHKEAQQTLWNFNFDHVGHAEQQGMARKAFFEARNRFEGARSDNDRAQALQDMQTMYEKLDKKAMEMSGWNGMIHTMARPVESGSVAAQELQERIVQDFNKSMLVNVNKQTILQQQMTLALEQMVKNTDPNQQGKVGGSL